MQQLIMGVVYIVFFFSGAAALIYEVLWVRSLSLVFGGTHLAVTSVLSVFMGGLALGSYIIGRRVDTLKKPLRFYGFLELGIALFAVLFIAFMKIYPDIYILLAGGGESSKVYLTFIRVVLTFIVLIVPTTLMGGTLPVLTRFVSGHRGKLGTKLSLLYGFNTLGAVAGTALAAFLLLRFYSVSTAFYTAITINIIIGLVSIVLQDRISGILESVAEAAASAEATVRGESGTVATDETAIIHPLSFRLVLWGIGISGFCALGYEVLWTRILTLTIGTSVYGFSMMLIAFLTGIALGSKGYALLRNIFPSLESDKTRLISMFGIVQFIIGGCALLVTYYIRDLPVNSIKFNEYYYALGLDLFHARQLANMTLAFFYMIVPSFFMGMAFPVAGQINILSQRTSVGHAVGEVLAYNTVGAIFGSAVSGFFMIYVFGIETSLQILTVINVGFGLVVVMSLRNSKVLNVAMAGVTVIALAWLVLMPDTFGMWDKKFFAIFQNNQIQTYRTPAKKREAIKNTNVLFYYEGIDSTISVIKVKGGNQGVLVNGKVVASASLADQHCQYTLGHLPMLLHKNPRKVLVVGLGTGMTLGATSVHPSVESLTLAEIEPHVVNAARTFAEYNNHVLDNPKLKIVFNDGRNFLMTTKNKYDVITADPIHPWTQGSGYLYTTEYFKLGSEHLAPGGIMCQWLPIYELSAADLKSVVKTFSQNFKYTMMWVTQHDAEIIGSNSPIRIDEEDLEKRIAFPAVAGNLDKVFMGSATDFLSFFMMGTGGMTAFGSDGIVNTDDNLFLEFSSPESLNKNLMGVNLAALAPHRESILPYLLPAKDASTREEQVRKWTTYRKAASLSDYVHALFLDGQTDTPEFMSRMAQLEHQYPSFAPGRFLRYEYNEEMSHIPTLLDKTDLVLLNDNGEKLVVEISAVIFRISDIRAKVVFVDNAVRKVFGQLYFSGDEIDHLMEEFTTDVLGGIQASYAAEVERSRKEGMDYPSRQSFMPRVADIIKAKCDAGRTKG